jgi:hypothetical protein
MLEYWGRVSRRALTIALGWLGWGNVTAFLTRTGLTAVAVLVAVAVYAWFDADAPTADKAYIAALTAAAWLALVGLAFLIALLVAPYQIDSELRAERTALEEMLAERATVHASALEAVYDAGAALRQRPRGTGPKEWRRAIIEWFAASEAKVAEIRPKEAYLYRTISEPPQLSFMQDHAVLARLEARLAKLRMIIGREITEQAQRSPPSSKHDPQRRPPSPA